MTANQMYKKIGGKLPFNEWVGEQRIKYGEKFVENEEFINFAAEAFEETPNPTTQFQNDPRAISRQQFVAENMDDNIVYPQGIAAPEAATPPPVSIPVAAPIVAATPLQPSTQTAGFTANKLLMMVVGGVALYYGYKWMTKKK